MPDLLKSKKFQAALLGLLLVIAHHFIPSLQAIDLYALLAPVVAYILGQGIADWGKERALIEAAYDMMPVRLRGELLETDGPEA